MLQKTPLNSSLIFAQKPNRFDQIVSELSAVETFRWFFFRERSKIVGKWINCPFSLAVWHLLIVPSFYYKNCYCRWQKWDNKTNKYRNAVNRAHKSQFSINFISHFWTKTKQFFGCRCFYACCCCSLKNALLKFIDGFMLGAGKCSFSFQILEF